jgi:protein-disulfide isomerase
MSLSRTTKLSLAASVLLVLIAIAVVALLIGRQGSERADSIDGKPQVLRDNTRILDEGPADGPVLVEFLDFECEVCAAAYPLVEELRATYDGELTFAVRYFPIPSHQNSQNAAIAVEAAAQQGQMEAMYRMMYDTQTLWGEQTDSKAQLFRTYAIELGLDLTAYDKAVADPETAARVQQDFDEGVALGVEGTPTFFLDGEVIDPTSANNFRELIAAKVNE